ncbi:MAG TPA: hypothetical protein VLA49_00260 [Anaerolineales bacterium]|nr:hypothetical protein [Anaerolineales bacterium]
MNLEKIFDLDPKIKRQIIFAAIWVTLLIVVALVPLVIQTNFFQSSGSAEQGYVPVTETLANTPTLLPSPNSQVFVRSSEAEPLATSVPKNCTYPAAYWLDQQQSWPALISVGDFNYTKEQALARIQSSSESVWDNLFLHLHASLLNVLSGSDPADIRRTVLDAISWLNTHPEESTPPVLDMQIGFVLIQQLYDYNNGVIGPGLCEGSPELQDESQLTAVFSLPTITLSATPTPNPFIVTPAGGGTIPVFTPTPTPTQKENVPGPPPTSTPVPPTRTNTPRPPTSTNTPRPPTDTPLPTDTPPPTNTPRPSDTPAPPTSAPTETPEPPPETTEPPP